MKRYVIVGMFAAALFGTVSELSADEKLYHLSKVPKFRVGDRAVAREAESTDFSVTTSDGKIVSRKKMRKDAHVVYEVTKVDKAGKIQAFRVSIISARAKFDITLPAPDKKQIAIEKIHFIARRKGLEFEADTATIVSEKVGALKASQIWLLKQHCKDWISLPMYPEDDALLFPREPVPVGHSWKPTRKTLDKWTEASSAAKKLECKALSAEFRFVSVTGGVALIEGDVVVKANFGGKRMKIPTRLTAKINTRSGRWVNDTNSGIIEMKMRHATMKMVGRGEESATFKPGKGRVSALPKKIFKIGWKRPGKDTNNHIDKTKGFSLNVPKSYTARKPPPDSPFLAQFVNKQGFIIGVTSDNADRPMDINEAVRDFLAGVRDDPDPIPGYTVVKREYFTLPNNVPAVLLTGKCYDGKMVLMTIMALDGKQVFTGSASAPTDMKDLLAEQKKTLKSLRLFEPDYTKAPPKTSAGNDERGRK